MPLSELRHPTLLRFLRWWEAKRCAGGLPARGDLEPLELRDVLPDIFLVHVAATGQGPRFTYRLTGTRIDQNLGLSVTGRALQECPFGNEAASIASQYEETVARRVPTFCRHRFVVGGRRRIMYQRLLLPLASDGLTVDMLAGAAIFEQAHNL